MKLTSIFTVVSIIAVSTLSASAYTEVQCDTDTVFSANSCNQCFTDKDRSEGSYLGELKDEWINNSTSDKILYKIEQEMPKMINLLPSLVQWKQDPSAQDFWEYPEELNKIYDNDDEGFILSKGKKVTWLKSKKGFTYKLEKNKAAEGKNIGLLTYLITTHNISEEGSINTDASEHRECVLFKSGKEVQQKKVVPIPKLQLKSYLKQGQNIIYYYY
ncbi:MAG: hypothetical protein Q9M97_06235 [Candidatus Gracilibacteria bacterium]|nr:hypothetical protein [Candidatus Gracilibacteria bacterium]